MKTVTDIFVSEANPALFVVTIRQRLGWCTSATVWRGSPETRWYPVRGCFRWAVGGTRILLDDAVYAYRRGADAAREVMAQ